MPPVREVTTLLFSADSGSVFKMGSAISRMGLICATESATPVRAAKAPVTMPKAVLKAMYSEGETRVFTARK